MKTTVTPIEPRTARSAASVNALYTGLAAIGTVGSDNLAPEGIDHLALDRYAHVKFIDDRTVAARAQLPESASWATFAGFAVDDILDAELGDLAADEALELRARFNFETTLSTVASEWEGIVSNADLYFRFAYHPGGAGVLAAVPRSTRRKRMRETHHGKMVMLGVLEGPIDFQTDGGGYLRIQYQATPVIGAPPYLAVWHKEVYWSVRKFKRVSL
jgi:hypothetical protein